MWNSSENKFYSDENIERIKTDLAERVFQYTGRAPDPYTEKDLRAITDTMMRVANGNRVLVQHNVLMTLNRMVVDVCVEALTKNVHTAQHVVDNRFHDVSRKGKKSQIDNYEQRQNIEAIGPTEFQKKKQQEYTEIRHAIQEAHSGVLHPHLQDAFLKPDPWAATLK